MGWDGVGVGAIPFQSDLVIFFVFSFLDNWVNTSSSFIAGEKHTRGIFLFFYHDMLLLRVGKEEKHHYYCFFFVIIT